MLLKNINDFLFEELSNANKLERQGKILNRYGAIKADVKKEFNGNHYRATDYSYCNQNYRVFMHNGNVTKITEY